MEQDYKALWEDLKKKLRKEVETQGQLGLASVGSYYRIETLLYIFDYMYQQTKENTDNVQNKHS